MKASKELVEALALYDTPLRIDDLKPPYSDHQKAKALFDHLMEQRKSRLDIIIARHSYNINAIEVKYPKDFTSSEEYENHVIDYKQKIRDLNDDCMKQVIICFKNSIDFENTKREDV